MIPPTVAIGYRLYKILPMPLGFEDAGQHTAGIIHLKSDTPPEVANTLLHEILHGCYEMGGLKDNDPEEKVVTVLSNQLCQVIKNNPAIIEFIVSGLK